MATATSGVDLSGVDLKKKILEWYVGLGHQNPPLFILFF